MRSLGRRRCVGGQRNFVSFIAPLLSERVRCSYRTPMTDCSFLAHFNIWWARHGWLLVHLVARLDNQFSRPPYFTAAVNLTAESAIEPPRGGEYGAGENCLNQKRDHSRNPETNTDYSWREPQTRDAKTPLTLRASQRRKKAIDASYI